MVTDNDFENYRKTSKTIIHQIQVKRRLLSYYADNSVTAELHNVMI